MQPSAKALLVRGAFIFLLIEFFANSWHGKERKRKTFLHPWLLIRIMPHVLQVEESVEEDIAARAHPQQQ